MIIIFNHTTGKIYGADPMGKIDNPDLVAFTLTKEDGEIAEVETTVSLRDMHKYKYDKDTKSLVLK